MSSHYKLLSIALIVLLVAAAVPFAPDQTVHASTIYRTTFSAAGQYLTVELLDNDLAHFELSQEAPGDSISCGLTNGVEDGLSRSITDQFSGSQHHRNV